MALEEIALSVEVVVAALVRQQTLDRADPAANKEMESRPQPVTAVLPAQPVGSSLTRRLPYIFSQSQRVAAERAVGRAARLARPARLEKCGSSNTTERNCLILHLREHRFHIGKSQLFLARPLKLIGWHVLEESAGDGGPADVGNWSMAFIGTQ